MKLHYVERGKGMAVVLVHGFPLDGRMWEGQLEALSDRYRVIAVDLPGFGESKSEAAFTMGTLAEELHRNLSEMGALPCVLGGLSMGGYVALAYVEKYPGDLKGLMLLDTKAEADTAAGKEGRGKMIELVREKGSKAVADQMMGKMVSVNTLRNSPAVADRLRGIMEDCPAKTIENALVAMRDRPDRTGMLKQIKVPVLIVVGEEDAITPVAVAEGMKKEIANVTMKKIKGAGHMSPLERSGEVTEAMRGFLEMV